MSNFVEFMRTLILLGALQGFIVSILLFFQARPRQSNRILAVLIFLMALASLNLYLLNVDWIGRSEILFLLSYVLPMIIIMPIGPLIYFYIRSFSDSQFVFKKTYRLHFIPVIIDLLPYLAAFIYFTGLSFKWIPKNDAPWGNFIDQCNVYSDIPRWLSISIYLLVSKRYLKSIKLKNDGSGGQQQYFRWLNQFVQVFTVFQVIWLAYLIPYEIPKYSNQLMDVFGWYPVYIPLSILIYYLGIKGWLASSGRAERGISKSRSAPKVPDSLSQAVIEKLKHAMETEKRWLDPSLNLSILSGLTNIPPKTISAVLNQQLHKSFNEFINEYRIVAVKERLLSSDDANLTIAGLAYECGFNSQPTFQRAFKSIAGESPTEFIQKRNNGKQSPANPIQIRI